MTDSERLASLEARLAAAEARVAMLESRQSFPALPSLPSVAPFPCGYCGSFFCGGFHVTNAAAYATVGQR